MAAPLVTGLQFPRGPGQIGDNITSLANNNARGLGIIGSGGVDAKDIKIGCVLITTGTIPGSPNGTGTASLYLASSEDGTNFTDFLNPNSTDGSASTGEGVKFVLSQSLTSMLVQRIFCPASATQYSFNAFSIGQKLDYVPTFIALYIANNTGAQFSSDNTKFVAFYNLVLFQ